MRVGMQKDRISAIFLTLACSLLCVSVYVYKWTNEHCKGLRVSGLQQVGGRGPLADFGLRRTASLANFFIFFAFFPIYPPLEYKCLIINNKYLSLKRSFSFRN